MALPSLSLEFFPPRNAAQERRFWRTFGALETLKPVGMSITWGALGSASEASLGVLTHLVESSDVPVTAHLSCAGQTAIDMHLTIDTLSELGISRILALRGDQIAGANADDGALRHASDLVELLASRGGFDISVAAYPEAHPEAASLADDLIWLRHKLDAGASRAITQYFFEPQTYLRFRDQAARLGIHKPLIPGILPIHDIDKVVAFSERCGATVPSTIIERFRPLRTIAEKQAAAVEQCVELCQALHREGVDAFHLYTLNQSQPVAEVMAALRADPVVAANVAA